MTQLSTSGGPSIRASVSATVLPMNIPGRLTGLISLQAKGLPRVFSSTTFRKQEVAQTLLSNSMAIAANIRCVLGTALRYFASFYSNFRSHVPHFTMRRLRHREVTGFPSGPTTERPWGKALRPLPFPTILCHLPRECQPHRNRAPSKPRSASAKFLMKKIFAPVLGERIAGLRQRKPELQPAIDLCEKINWHQTGKSLALGNLGEFTWGIRLERSLQSKGHFIVLIAEFSGASRYQEV